MAILNAIVALLGRTVGRILSALLDWAVVALFGRVAGSRKLVLLGMMAAAAAWPILLLGVIWPKAVLFVVAFVPLSHSIASGWIRPIWVALALLVPVTVGLTLTLQGQPERCKGMASGIVCGFLITAGLAAAFLILLVTVPALRIGSALRGRQDVYVPLVTTDASYRVAADLVADTLRRHGIDVRAAEPPWWSALPSRILLQVGKSAFADYVAELAAYFRSSDLEVTLYPNALLLRGTAAATAHAHMLAIETVTGRP